MMPQSPLFFLEKMKALQMKEIFHPLLPLLIMGLHQTILTTEMPQKMILPNQLLPLNPISQGPAGQADRLQD